MEIETIKLQSVGNIKCINECFSNQMVKVVEEQNENIIGKSTAIHPWMDKKRIGADVDSMTMQKTRQKGHNNFVNSRDTP